MKREVFVLALSSLLILQSCGNGDNIDASGIFESREILVSSEMPGRIVSYMAAEGEQVECGAVIATLDTTQLYLQKMRILASKGALLSRKSDINKQIAAIKQQIENAKRERDRFSKLLSLNAVNSKSVDDIDYQISVLNRQLEAQESALSRANISMDGESRALMYQVAQLDDQISKSQIKSPIYGTILETYSEEGEFAAVGRPIFKIADISVMTLRAYLSSGLLDSLFIGKDVKVVVSSGDNERIYTGKISWISDRAEFTPKTIQTKEERENLVYAVKIIVKNDGFLRIGMYGDVIIK